MAPEVVLQHLESVLAQESVPAERQALRLLARAARGSMRDALSLTDQAIAYGNGRIEEAAVRQMLGSADRDIVLRLIEALAQGDGKTVVGLCDELRAAGLNPASMLEDMAAVLQRMAVRQAAPDLPADDSDPEAAAIARLAAAMPADETQLLYSLCIHGRAELGFAPDEYAGLVMTLLRLLPFKAGPAAEQEKKSLKTGENSSFPRKRESMSVTSEPAPMDSRLRGNDEGGSGNDEGGSGNDAGEGMAPEPPPWDVPFEPAEPPPAALPARPKVQPLPVRETVPPQAEDSAQEPAPDASEIIAIEVRESAAAPPPPAPAPVPEPPAVRATGEGDFWHKLVRDLVARDAVSALPRELALQAQLVERAGDAWTLRVENKTLAQSAAAERLQEALHAAGHAVRLKVDVGAVEDSPARRNAIAATRRHKAAEALLMADPFVQEMVRDFGAKIVPASVKAL